MFLKSLSVNVAFLTALLASSIAPSGADEGSVTVSESESYESRGVGFRGANKVEFKYKERLKNWGEQIEMGLSKGWLNNADATVFKGRLEQLRTLEAEVSGRGYPKPELDDMEKQFTKFNQDLSDAGSKLTSPAVPKGADKSPADVMAPEPEASTPASPAKKVSTTGSAKAKVVTKKTITKKTTTKKSATSKN